MHKRKKVILFLISVAFSALIFLPLEYAKKFFPEDRKPIADNWDRVDVRNEMIKETKILAKMKNEELLGDTDYSFFENDTLLAKAQEQLQNLPGLRGKTLKYFKGIQFYPIGKEGAVSLVLQDPDNNNRFYRFYYFSGKWIYQRTGTPSKDQWPIYLRDLSEVNFAMVKTIYKQSQTREKNRHRRAIHSIAHFFIRQTQSENKSSVRISSVYFINLSWRGVMRTDKKFGTYEIHTYNRHGQWLSSDYADGGAIIYSTDADI